MAFDSNIKGYMTFGKSFSRGGAFPLEAYEIWTDYDALVAYAANTNPDKDPSYIGQKVAYVDKTNNKVTHYGIEIDGTLKELGASPIGDEKSIVIGANNTISLKGIAGLVFERDIIGEDGEPTGQKENVQFQPLMTKDGLVWVEPSKTTVEGLTSLIDGLTTRVSALENDRVTEQELADAVKVVADKIGVAEDGETAATGVYAYVDGAISAAIAAEGHPEYSITKVTTTTGYSATYQLTKDGTAVGTKIDIPKDMVVSKGEVVTYSNSGAWGNAGTYIALTLANATSDTLYIPVDDLIEYVTSGSTADSQVIVAIDETTHKVTATIGAGKIGDIELAQTVKNDIAQGATAHGWGDHASAGYLKSGDISGKADKKVPTTAGNLASLDANGNLGDSGKKVGDFATSSQGTKADSALQEVEIGEGLKASAKASNKQKIEIDTDVIFVLNANF